MCGYASSLEFGFKPIEEWIADDTGKSQLFYMNT
jgi:hypothetical protein